ncbi:MAG: hypothetical protein RQ729_13020, partial [Wenzhouxiangellaceae bacterium]|nr:hypothetical protein [Wenzhouxiangellaceae bacterium]
MKRSEEPGPQHAPASDFLARALHAVARHVTVNAVIRSFRHKGLRQLFDAGDSAKVSPDQQARILRLLDVLESSAAPGDMNLPGFH